MKKLSEKEKYRAELYIKSCPTGSNVGYACAQPLTIEDEKWLESIGYHIIKPKKSEGKKFSSVMISESAPLPSNLGRAFRLIGKGEI